MTRSNTANAFETVTTATVNSTDLTFPVQSTSGGPSSPAWLCIAPDDPTKREYVYFDGTFTGTSFVTTSLDNRYGDGSAASSGLSHDAGTVVRSVPASQHFNELHNRIDTHVDLTNPHSATDAATPSRLMLRDGSGRAKVADPSVDADIATKGYVDLEGIGTFQNITPLNGWTGTFRYRTEAGGSLVRVICGLNKVGAFSGSQVIGELPAAVRPVGLARNFIVAASVESATLTVATGGNLTVSQPSGGWTTGFILFEILFSIASTG
jgi:hypothetical protein